MQWIEVSIVCERVATDEVTTLFDDYADNGIIEEDIEEQPNLVKLTLYADPALDADVIKADLEKRLTEANITVKSIDAHILDESTWLNSWQQYIEPTEILPNIVIKPAWQEYDNVDNKTVIEIDSDISFGTGSHETTRTCAELLKGRCPSRWRECRLPSGRKRRQPSGPCRTVPYRSAGSTRR